MNFDLHVKEFKAHDGNTIADKTIARANPIGETENGLVSNLSSIIGG